MSSRHTIYGMVASNHFTKTNLLKAFYLESDGVMHLISIIMMVQCDRQVIEIGWEIDNKWENLFDF